MEQISIKSFFAKPAVHPKASNPPQPRTPSTNGANVEKLDVEEVKKVGVKNEDAKKVKWPGEWRPVWMRAGAEKPTVPTLAAWSAGVGAGVRAGVVKRKAQLGGYGFPRKPSKTRHTPQRRRKNSRSCFIDDEAGYDEEEDEEDDEEEEEEEDEEDDEEEEEEEEEDEEDDDNEEEDEAQKAKRQKAQRMQLHSIFAVDDDEEDVAEIMARFAPNAPSSQKPGHAGKHTKRAIVIEDDD